MFADDTKTADLPWRRPGVWVHALQRRYPTWRDLRLATERDIRRLPGCGPAAVRDALDMIQTGLGPKKQEPPDISPYDLWTYYVCVWLGAWQIWLTDERRQ